MLTAFTTGGQSENIRRALIAARKLGLTSIAFLGKDGGRCAGLADIELIVSSTITARVQEGHKLLLPHHLRDGGSRTSEDGVARIAPPFYSKFAAHPF